VYDRGGATISDRGLSKCPLTGSAWRPRIGCLSNRDDAVGAGRKVLTRLDLTRVSTGVPGDAALLLPADLRSLDAIHIATARRLGRDLAAIITYHEHVAEVAMHLGPRVAGRAHRSRRSSA
jgi:hypothetical protein